MSSGTTCTCLLLFDSKIVVGNVGDSKCILYSLIEDRMFYRSLTFNHKPSESKEHNRIIASGGEIYKINSNNAPYRVWMKGKDFPGLAITRSLGDTLAASVGVISDPEVVTVNLHENDKALILASDGVWDKLTEEEVIKIAKMNIKLGLADYAVNAIIDEARKRWENSGPYIDDISCVIIIL